MPTKPHLDTNVGKLRAAIIDVIGEERYQELKIKASTQSKNFDRLDVYYCLAFYHNELDIILRIARKHYGLDVCGEYIATRNDKTVNRYEFYIRKG